MLSSNHDSGILYTAIEFYKESCVFVRVLKSKRLRSPSRPTTNQEVLEKPTGSFQHAFTHVFHGNFLIFRFFVYGFTGGISTPKWFTEIEQDFISGFHFQASRRLLRSRVVGEGWTPPLALQKSGNHHQPPIFYGYMCPSIAHFLSEEFPELKSRRKDRRLSAGFFFRPGFVFEVWYFLCWMVTSVFFIPKEKGDYVGGGYKFDSSKATPLSMLILNRNWKKLKTNFHLSCESCDKHPK